MPTLNYEFSWNANTGGRLLVNGKLVDYSPRKRLLGLDPFGQMVELQLSDAEADIVATGHARDIWNKIVLPKLYSFSGTTVGEKREGHWICSDREGLKAYEGDYSEGRQDGKWLYFSKAGCVRAELNYVKGQRDGKWTYYAEDGKVENSLTWRKDVPVERSVSQTSLGGTDVLFPNGNSEHSRF